MSANSANSIVSANQVMSAGLAATGASFVTSRFGVAGTLLGAALTAMIITGGSAILRSYLEAASGRVRGLPTKLGARRGPHKAGDLGGTMPGRPDLRDNFVGRMRAALDWFSHLPTLSRRSILVKGLLAAAVAFIICMGVVWGAEKVIGNSLSCGLWSKCPYGAVPGIHPLGYGDDGAGSSISGGGMNTGEFETPSFVDRVSQNRNPFGGDRSDFGNPGGGNPNGGIPGVGSQNRNPFGGDRSDFGNAGGGNPNGGIPGVGNQGGGGSSTPPDPAASPPPGGGQESPPPDQGGESVPPTAGQQDPPSSAPPKAGR